MIVDVPAIVAAESGRVGCENGGVVLDRPHVEVGVVVAVEGVIRVLPEAVGGEEATRRHDAVVRREDVTTAAVCREGRGHELHRAVCARGAQADHATEPAFDQVDRRQVGPADTRRNFGFAVVTEQFLGRRRGVDAPRGQCLLRALEQRVELVARVDVVVVDVEELRRNPRRAIASAPGFWPRVRYATCWRRAALVSTDSEDDGSRSACSSATRPSASCAGSDASRGCAGSVVATGDGMAVGTTDGVTVGVDAVGDEVGCEQAATANVIAAASSAMPQRIPLS